MKSLVILIICLPTQSSAQTSEKEFLSFSDAVNNLALHSQRAQSAWLQYDNAKLTYDNYKKSFLPQLRINLKPITFNHAMKLLQDPYSGEYRNIEDFANTSIATLTISQKVGPTGGILSATTGLSYLHEFTNHRDNYSSTPFYVSYSQQIIGGFRSYMQEKKVSRLQYELAAMTVCQALAREQCEVARLYISACLALLRKEQAMKDIEAEDSLLFYARIRHENGYITDYDMTQIRLEHLQAIYTQAQYAAHAKEALHSLALRLGCQNENLSIFIPNTDALPSLLIEAEVKMQARQNNPEYKSAELRRTQAIKNLHHRKLANRFNASVSLSYGLNQYANTLCGAYQHPNQQQSVGLTLSIPVFDWGISRNQRRMAENDFDEETILIEESCRMADNEIITRTMNYNLASSQYEISREQYKLAIEQYSQLISKFSQGSASVYELISANRAKQNTLINHMNVVRALFDEYYTIQQLTLYNFCENRRLSEVYGIKID